MRALAQGLDERESWDRYLRSGGEHADGAQVRRTIAWVRDAFSAAARREHRPGTARLILLDPDGFSRGPILPTLAEFAAAEGLEDFSETEQIEAYEAAHPGGKQTGQGRGAAARRARVIARQLEALRWLETLVARDPQPGDGVGGWLNPGTSARLERAGFTTLEALVQTINAQGARWWRAVPGIGAGKAARIIEWLQAHEPSLGLTVKVHGRTPRRKLRPDLLASVVPAATALVPYEKFVVPEDFNGREGRFRNPVAKCRLAVTDDHGAIGAWLAAKSPQGGGPAPPKVPLSPTQRAYRREAERLLLWSVLERGTALSSLTEEDAAAFSAFLTAPPQAWCGPRHQQRWSPLWRPLEGPLTAGALRQSLTILRSLYSYLVEEGYVNSNPFDHLLRAPSSRPSFSPRTLSRAQWDLVNQRLENHGAAEPARRLRRAIRWIQATGLRVAEITAARCGDLRAVDAPAAGGASCTAWLLAVGASGAAQRLIPVPAELVTELQQEIVCFGLDPDTAATPTGDIPILARFSPRGRGPAPWSASGLYQAMKSFLAAVAEEAPANDSKQLRKASAHWLRNVRS
ncbi:MAG: integrase [Comamonadaceae bacterium]|nr:MAG: integrase [Comamonadaceae bacterium]